MKHKEQNEKMKLLACNCLYDLLGDPTKKWVMGFYLPLTVKASRAKNGNGYHVTIGKPNYEVRVYLKQCKKAKCKPRIFWIRFFKEGK
jgi:hypothetical protein